MFHCWARVKYVINLVVKDMQLKLPLPVCAQNVTLETEPWPVSRGRSGRASSCCCFLAMEIPSTGACMRIWGRCNRPLGEPGNAGLQRQDPKSGIGHRGTSRPDFLRFSSVSDRHWFYQCSVWNRREQALVGKTGDCVGTALRCLNSVLIKTL